MPINTDLAYLLLYCANIDTQIDAAEKDKIKSHLSCLAAYEDILQTFESDDAHTRLQKVESTIKTYKATLNGEAELMREVKELFSADADFSAIERYLLGMIGRD